MNTERNQARMRLLSLLVISCLAWPAWAGVPASGIMPGGVQAAVEEVDEATSPSTTTDTPSPGATSDDATDQAEVNQASLDDQADEPGGQVQPDTADITPVVGWLELSDTLRDGPIPFAWVSPEEAGASLGDVIDQLDYVAEHDEYLGVVIYMDHPTLRL